MMYGPKGLRFNAVAPGPTITGIVVNWGSQLAAERLGPLMQATVPTPATAAQLAAPSPSCSARTAPTSTVLSSPPTAAGPSCSGAASGPDGAIASRGCGERRRVVPAVVVLPAIGRDARRD
ncbi:NAD(P)-dependent dehydrogenase (short-subunit alcohol dehydrogenase family) [Arthrobacter sp. V1I7]|nr:NAD(P)-dependent dehydrogenase (short-subunit alcohol dehydrogenase family) [Arthrobacter sp. V1I7]